MHNIKKIFIILSFLLITVLAFLSNDINNQDNKYIKTEDNNIEKTIEIKNMKESKKNIYVKKDTHIDNQLVKENIQKENYIYKTKDYSGKYTLSILSNEKLEMPNIRTSYKFFSFPGILEDKQGKSGFSLSIREDYLSLLDTLYFQLYDITTNKKVQCSTGFLPELEENTIYTVKFDYIDDTLSCFVFSTQEKPNFLIEKSKNLPDKIFISDLPKELRDKFIEKK